MTLLLSSQSSLLVREVFAGWSECLKKSGKWELERLREELVAARMESKNQARQSLIALLGSQASSTLGVCMAAWHKVAGAARTEEALQQAQEEARRRKQRGQESTLRALRMLTSA